MGPLILIIDDDPAFRGTLERILSRRGYRTRSAASGGEGLATAKSEMPDLVLLDLVLPGLGGMDVCQGLKQKAATAGIPILMVTANDKQGQEVACLDMGADDYLTKPVSTERLLARCRALLRRSERTPPDRKLVFGELVIDYDGKSVEENGRRTSHLTPMEFELLYTLARQSPHPIDRRSLYEQVWGIEPPSDGSLKTVEVHIRRLRLKLHWRSDERIVMVRGRGYSFRP